MVVVAADAVAVAVADAVAAVAVTVPPQAARFYYCPLPRFSEGQHCRCDVHDMMSMISQLVFVLKKRL